MKWFENVYFVTILLYCGIIPFVNSLESEYIIGGETSEMYNFPYQVVIEHESDDESNSRMCGGGIIHEMYVLTAAHCVIDIKTNHFLEGGFRVTAGTADLAFPSIEVDVKKIYVPSSFSVIQQPFDDIAIVELGHPLDIKGSSRMGKLKIPQTHLSYAGRKAKIAGFGWNWIQVTEEYNENGGWFHSHMKFLYVNVIKNQECQKINDDLKITHRHICAKSIQRYKDDVQAVCSGDSGSPLVIEDTVIGILSTSPDGCNETVRSAVYTRVSTFKHFIENVTNNIINEYIRVHKVKKSFTGRIIDYIKSHFKS